MAKKKVKKIKKVIKKSVKKKSVSKKAKVVTKKAKAIVKKSKPAVKKTKPAKKSKAIAAVKPAQSTKLIKPIDLKNFVTPLDDRLIVQVENKDRMTPGGLYIPDTVENTTTYFKGLILSVGRGHRDAKGRIRPMDVKVGDRVLFNSTSGAKLTYQSVDLKILRETDVMGVIDKD